MSEGVFLLASEKIICLSKVEIFKTTNLGLVALVTWEDESGKFPNTLIEKDQFKDLFRIGAL